METSSTTPTNTKFKNMATQTPLIPWSLEQSFPAELLLTRTPEVEGLLPGYNPEAWTIYIVSVDGIELPYAPGHGGFRIMDIEEDESGVFWMGTTHGLVRFDGQHWELLSSETKVIGLVHVVVADDGSIWFTMSGGVYRYADGRVSAMYELSEGEILGWLEKTPAGNIWMSTWSYPNGDILLSYNSGKWEPLTFENESPFRSIANLVFDSEGRLYIWGLHSPNIDSCLAYYQDGEWVVFDQRELYGSVESIGFYDEYVQLVADEQDHIWFYMQGQGLFELYDDQIQLRALPLEDYLKVYNPGPIVFDNEEVLWLGALSLGAYLTKHVPGIDHFQSIDGSDEFFVHSGGSDEEPLSRYRAENIIPFKDVSSLFVDSRNRLWIGTSSGVFIFDLN
jgi:ligand-binding sensor domain-containing protein